MTKGSRGERYVSNKIEDELDAYAQPTGASGGATTRNRPDVIGMQSRGLKTRAYFFEIKSRDDGMVRFSKEEVRELQEAAERAGAQAVLCTKPDLRKHDHCHCFFPDELKENEKSFSIVKSHLPGRPLADLF